MADESYLKALVDTDPQWFESQVLARAAMDPEWFASVRSVLCVHPVTGEHLDDFESATNNLVWRVLSIYYECVGTKGAPIIDLQFVNVACATLIEGSKMLTGEVDIVLNKIAKAVACDLNAVAPVTDDGFAYWLKKNRLIRAMEEVEGDPLVSPDEVPSRIRMYTEPVSAKERGEYVFQFGHGIDNEMLNVTRLRTGLDKLDKAMGGGFGKGEGTLLMGTTGGGKTTVTCQLAARFVLDGAFGLFITTEQGHAELEPRIVSNYCNVPFDLIKDKVDIAVFNHDQKVKYDILREKLRPLYFAEWKMDRGKSVQDDLESEIVTYAEKHGRIDFVIMDWIGGALGSSSKGRDQEIRHIFQSTADKLWSIADKHRVASIATAQLNPKQAINKSAPDHTMLSECKTMGNNACYIIGITSLFAKIEDNKQNNDQPPGWSDKQFLYVCKGRKSQGGAVPFKRRYDYQRLENC